MTVALCRIGVLCSFYETEGVASYCETLREFARVSGGSDGIRFIRGMLLTVSHDVTLYSDELMRLSKANNSYVRGKSWSPLHIPSP